MISQGDKRIYAVIIFAAMVLIANHERIGVFFLYRIFGLKIHNTGLKALISIGVLIVGLSIFILALYQSLHESSTTSVILNVAIILVILIFMIIFSKKSRDFLFPL
jgi:hypothetical protein